MNEAGANEHVTTGDGMARAAALRASFDRAFTEPARGDLARMEDFLAIQVGEDVFVLRLTEIAGIYLDKPLTRVPGGESALLGVAGFRGVIQPVYALAALLGRPVERAPRWLVVAATAPVALAFDAFDQHLRVAADMVRPRDERTRDHPHARDFLPVRRSTRPILHLPSILAAIRTQRPGAAPDKEH